MQRIEAFFHMTPHFAYPLMVILSILLLPALLLMPATNALTMLAIDLPLCIGTTGRSSRSTRWRRLRREGAVSKLRRRYRRSSRWA
jgi:hypothetical protein